MLRRTPFTPLVCLVVLVATSFMNTAWGAGPDDSLEILLKPNKSSSSPSSTVHKARPPARAYARRSGPYGTFPYAPPPQGICKVKPAYKAICGPRGCILARPKARQWEMSAQAFFARTKGIVQWPRYSRYYVSVNQGTENWADLNDDLKLPEHATLPEFSARYQFKPNWGMRYEVLWDEVTGGGRPTRQFLFGSQSTIVTFGQEIRTRWLHSYHRMSLVYDAVTTPQSVISVAAGWMHAEDQIDLNCVACGLWTRKFSKSMDAIMVELQFQRCIRTARNGGTLSWDHKATVMFMDDVEGIDLEAAGRFSTPLNCGRWGFVKGGYRFVQLKKGQTDYAITTTFEGGFLEGGLIF